MEWSKIKNIIILILLMVNVFLLVLTANQELHARQYREEAVAGAVETLKEQGITVEQDKLPSESTLTPLTAERDKESEQRMAEALLGVVVRTDDGGRATYTGNGGEAWFRSNGSFAVTFSGQVWSAGEQQIDAYSVKLLGEAGFHCQLVSRTEETQVVVRQTWEETPLFNCQAVLTYENKTLKSIEGQRLTGTPVENAQPTKKLDIATVLIRFLSAMREGGHVFSRLESMVPGYKSSSSPGGVTELEPVWEMRTDGGVFFVDSATGALG